ncbi:MAG: hypothetical protein ACI9VS_003558 [Candidatus Binatia bacterium]|jgi:hypothetical protein
MAWRIDEHVERGEIDNRVKGFVRGKIWLAGREKPLQLELTGNGQRDLAGCLLTFHNPGETFPLPADANLFADQKGSIGDLTASRKVRVFDIPFDEAHAMIKNGEKPPEHMANCLYLEWFSDRNGRVVIETADFKLTLSEPHWELTDENEAERARTAARGFGGFIEKLSDAVENAKTKVDYEKEDWDEFDYEKFLRESDARTDKYGELLDKHGHDKESREKIDREMGWIGGDDGGKEAESEDDEDFAWRDADSSKAPELIPEPATEGRDWIRCEDGSIGHPLQEKCAEGAIALWREIDALGLKENDDPLAKLLVEYQIIGAKLAGALNGLAYGRDLRDSAFVVACLKRALSHLHAAQEGLAEVQADKVKTLPSDTIDRVRKELFEIREGILSLMDEFRGRSMG